MKTYELLLILSPQFSDEELPGVLDGIFEIIRKEGGEIKSHKVAGRQALSYPINHMKHGCYVFVEIEIDPLALPKINRNLRLSTEILRFDISKNVSSKEFKSISASSAPSKKEIKIDFGEEQEVKISPTKKEEPETEETTETNAPELPIKEMEGTETIPSAKRNEDKIPLEDLDKKLDEILNEEVL